MDNVIKSTLIGFGVMVSLYSLPVHLNEDLLEGLAHAKRYKS